MRASSYIVQASVTDPGLGRLERSLCCSTEDQAQHALLPARPLHLVTRLHLRRIKRTETAGLYGVTA